MPSSSQTAERLATRFPAVGWQLRNQPDDSAKIRACVDELRGKPGPLGGHSGKEEEVLHLLIVGCLLTTPPTFLERHLPSGPGGYHEKPAAVYCNEAIELEWKQVIRGYRGRGVEKRYSAERAFCRVSGKTEFREIEVKRSVGTAKLGEECLVLQATIPSVHAVEGDHLEYYLALDFDGHRVRSPMSGFDRDSPDRVHFSLEK